MRTPSLHRRVTRSAVVLVAAVLLVVDVVLYVALAARLEGTLEEVLSSRTEIARELATELEPDALVTRLAAAGIPARVVDPEGQEHRSNLATVRAGELPPADPDLPPEPRVSNLIELDDGTAVTVFASRAGVQQTLRGLLAVQILVTAAGLLAAGLLSRWASRVSLGPLDEVAETARRIERGDLGERLSPDRPDTELGSLATAFDRMVASLEAALDETRRAERRTRRFLDDAAHQLRTPLTGIQGSAEAVMRESDPERRERLLANLVRETRRMTRLVESLLALARLDAREDEHPEGSRPSVDLVAVVRDEVERAQALSPSLRIDLTGADAPVDPIHVPIDRGSLADALGNLLDNARRHAATTVTVDVRANDRAAVRVSDDGPGVPEEHRTLVFERFASLDGKGGSGLGLPIARGIARLAGGDLEHDGDGFLLTLPLDAVAPSPAPAADGASAASR